MRERVFLDELTGRLPALSACGSDILKAYRLLESCFSGGGKVLLAGNGGSCADAEHIAAELMKGFQRRRRPDAAFRARLASVDAETGALLSEQLQGALPAIALHHHPALATAFLTDCDPYGVFAQQIYGYAKKGDVFFALSTGGNTENIWRAAVTARAMDVSVLALTGERESRLSRLSDVCVRLPQRETFLVQELCIPVYHCLCRMIEARFFPE